MCKLVYLYCTFTLLYCCSLDMSVLLNCCTVGMSVLVYSCTKLVAGTLYPAYGSFKAVKERNVKVKCR